jgi:hypothetical protein
MKKFVLSSLLFLLIGSFGGTILLTTHADTLSPAEAAALSQSLDVMKAKLLDLQAQTAAQAALPATADTATLSAQDIATMNTALQALGAALGQLGQTVAADPSALTENNRTALQSILGGVSASLFAMNQTLAGTGASAAPIAIAPASTVSAVASPSNQTPSLAQTNNQAAQTTANQNQSQFQPALATGNNAAPGTAQVSGHVPLGQGWMITFGAIALILVLFFVWRARRGKKTAYKPVSQPNVPVSSVSRPNVVPMSSGPKPLETKTASQRETPRSPMSSVITSSSPNNSRN